MKLKFTTYLLLLLLPLLLSGCKDELDYEFGEFDGSTRDIFVQIAYEAEDEVSVESRAGSIAGNSIENINNLRVLVYDASDALVKNFYIYKNGANWVCNDPDISSITCNNKADNTDSSDVVPGTDPAVPSGDTASGLMTFRLKLTTGRYRIYAVANCDGIPNGLTDSSIATPHALKSIRRTWVADDISQNSEMFGVFSLTPDRGATDESTISVTTATTSIHAWVKRLASKVTVAFDGTKLYDNVQIYIESVSIRDIPKECSLGYPNVPGLINPSSVTDYSWLNKAIEDPAYKEPSMAASNTRYTVSNGVTADGGTDVLQTINRNLPVQSAEYLHVCNVRHPYLSAGSDKSNINDPNYNSENPEVLTNAHAHTSRAFFFYENMQGKGKSKLQSQDGETITHPNPVEDNLTSGWKDSKSYGTYVEVKGFYRSATNDDHVSSGDITFRFMLGQDAEHDYNVERNRHYQLTLCFKGYGNDADWHIVYEDTREIQVQSPLYISYLYNKKMMATVRVKGEMKPSYRLRATITECKWEPWGDNQLTQFPMPTSDDFCDNSRWNGGDGPWFRSHDGKWNSFLATRATKVMKVEIPGYENMPSNKTPDKQAWQYNQDYYELTNKGWRTYEITPKTGGYDSNDNEGMYFVTDLSPASSTKVTERLFTIPFYTRAKELITRTSFTGNNPYYEYPRMAKVRLEIVNGDEENSPVVTAFKPVELQIIQVRRVLNPKGVWRKGGSKEPFHVTLMRLPKRGANINFEPFNSEGKWYAEVISSSEGSGVVDLSTTVAGSGTSNKLQNHVNRIEGESEHPVDFMINFTGKQGFAIVRVRYHNYTCEHDIYCRNGYDPVDVSGNGNYWWPSYNIDHFKDGVPVYTKSPLQQGSFFRYGNYTAILASNDKKYGWNKGTGAFDVIKDDGTTGSMNWGDITASANNATTETYNFVRDNGTKGSQTVTRYTWKINEKKGVINKNEMIPDGEAFYEFISPQANSLTFPIQKAYGIVYGDGATETQTDRTEAIGYDRTDGAPTHRGMQGVIVYNNQTLRMIFLPVGMTGYGHRQVSGATSGSSAGVLRYAGRAVQMPTTVVHFFPIFYNICEFPGAIYWMNHYYPTVPNFIGSDNKQKDYIDGSKSSAFDINYTTMGFEGYGGNDATPSMANAHGCFIRTVRTKPGPSPYDPKNDPE